MRKFKLRIKINTSLLIGGQTSSTLLDAATAREASGVPIIPASALKGALRIELERLIKALRGQNAACLVSDPEKACSPQNPCTACKIFGGPGSEGKIRFTDAKLADSLRKLFTRRNEEDKYRQEPTGAGYGIRHGVAISRRRNAAQEEMYFNAEVLSPFPQECVFESELWLLRDFERDEEELFRAAVKSLEAIGGDKSRGLGWVKAELEELDPERGQGQPEARPQAEADKITLLLSPVEHTRVSGTKPASYFLETLDHIPGSTLRGAVAKSFSDSLPRGWQDEAFKEAFLKKPTLFSNFYPTVGGLEPPKPIPLSARTCKVYPGFNKRAETLDSKESHGTRDILIDSLLVKKGREVGLPLFLDERCSFCAATLKPHPPGFYLHPDQQSGAGGARRVTTKTAINRKTHTSQEGQLYSYELIDVKREFDREHRVRFVGTVTNLTPQLREHLEKLEHLMLGGSRGRGLGLAKVRVEPFVEDQEIESRVDGFNEKLRQRMEQICSAFSGSKEVVDKLRQTMEGRLFFSLTLTSDLALLPGMDQKGLQGEISQRLDLNDLRLEKTIARTSIHGGWNDALGIQKDLIPVVCRGSVFVFSCTEQEKDTLCNNVPKLAEDGLGLKREEGFGRFTFCDSFHVKRLEQR